MELEDQIKYKIKIKNRDIRLDTFIKLALFQSNGYYYNKKPIGRKNDFVTSPEISQMFGEIIGLYLFYVWREKINSNFNLIELGPGNGTLFKDIANSVSKYEQFISKADIRFIEINRKLIEIQKKVLREYQIKNLKWVKSINYKSNLPSLIYSNEFFDCFPIRQFILNKHWYEKFVSLNTTDNKFYLKNKIVKNKELISLLNLQKKQKIYELASERNKYFENICKFIKNKGGLFLTIDYGYFKGIKNFTLQAIQNHKYSNVLENIGKQDITSHVNFEDFLNIAKKHKLQIDEICTQRDFLVKFGILERGKILSKLYNTKKISYDLNRLIGKKEMGTLFKCLIVSKL